MKDIVSIIIPSYNSAKYVCEAVDCCLNQTYAKIEILVIDDGSNDNTRTLLLHRYGSRIKYCYQENKGLSGARNAGLNLASGEYIQFLDADDLIHPHKLQAQLDYFSDRDISVVYSDYEYFLDGSYEIKKPSLPEYKAKYRNGNVWTSLLTGNFIVCHSPLFKKKILDVVGGFDETLNACEDYDLLLRIAAAGYKFIFDNNVHAYYRLRHGSMSTNTLKQALATSTVNARAEKYKHLSYHEKYLVKHYQMNLNRTIACLYKSRGEKLKALKHLVKASLWVPGEVKKTIGTYLKG